MAHYNNSLDIIKLLQLTQDEAMKFLLLFHIEHANKNVDCT